MIGNTQAHLSHTWRDMICLRFINSFAVFNGITLRSFHYFLNLKTKSFWMASSKHDARSFWVGNSPHRLYAATSGFQCGRRWRRYSIILDEWDFIGDVERVHNGSRCCFVSDVNDNRGVKLSLSSSLFVKISSSSLNSKFFIFADRWLTAWSKELENKSFEKSEDYKFKISKWSFYNK